MLAAGGSAVDAVIAAASMLAIVEPVSNGLGSDAFAILWDGTALHGLNASGAAPAGWDLGYFEGKYGAGGARRPLRGWDTVTVPGAISAWGGAACAVRPAALRRSARAGGGDRRARLCGDADRGGEMGSGDSRPQGPARLRRRLHAEGPSPRHRRDVRAARCGAHAPADRRDRRPRFLRGRVRPADGRVRPGGRRRTVARRPRRPPRRMGNADQRALSRLRSP